MLCRCSLDDLVRLLEKTDNLDWLNDLTLENVAAEIVRDLRQGLEGDAKVHVCLCLDEVQLLIRDAEAAGQDNMAQQVTAAVHAWMEGAPTASSQCTDWCSCRASDQPRVRVALKQLCTVTSMGTSGLRCCVLSLACG